MLKNIISKLVSRSEFKNKLRCESAYDNFKQANLSDARVLCSHQIRSQSDAESDSHFEMDSDLLDKLKHSPEELRNLNRQANFLDQMSSSTSSEKQDLKNLGNFLNNPLVVPNRKLPITSFDLKNLLQVTSQ